MRINTTVMIGFAVLFGLLAVFVAQSWLNNQAEMRLRSLEANRKPVATQTIVVASRPLRFGAELNGSSLREIAWPDDAVPAGAFARISDLMSPERRVVLTAIEANEPILASKITGPGQRATLSAMIADGMRAVTIRVNDVDGVAGFVLPGDRVDVALTRQSDKNNTSDVVLQNIKVLAIDQMADERTDKPAIARAVTLEVNATDAQKIALAATVGNMSLMLRRAGEAKAADTRRVTLGDLINGGVPITADEQETPRFVTIGVRRAGKRDDVSVPIEEVPSTVGMAARGRAAR
ncbi:MAG: Flp pilus assembly protein CpaB [Hyphomicrobiales bacterium]|nr:Flp pilus assembly protein CpaB [Hyphomicrobiales bacterium]